jgi:hypothetical protein
VSIYLLHVTAKKAECIDEVDAGFVYQQARVAAEEGLPVEIRALSPSVTESRHHVDVSELADRVVPLQFFI